MPARPAALGEEKVTCGADEPSPSCIEEVEGLLDLLDLIGRNTSTLVVLRAEG